MTAVNKGLFVQVGGIVQGVGFRPFVYGLAVHHELTGWVRNTSSGVEIEVNGPESALQAFLTNLTSQAPPLARIDWVQTRDLDPNGYIEFAILESQPQPGDFIPISPDVAICPDCRRELFDPEDRRYRYPFINCTNCGPRFTIIKDIPYDRPKTTMAGFTMCPACLAEYQDPHNRRFHAQPTACPVCGPQVWLIAGEHQPVFHEDALRQARQVIKDGGILAVKGLGGYHLACDATNRSSVLQIRQRKHRSEKPFALMAFNLTPVERHCVLSPAERDLITSPAHPIVLLERKEDSLIVPEAAPQQHHLGVMLAYTPLHLLLLEPEPGFPDMLVMTSGNLSEEPIAYQDDDALQRLAPLADAFLLHDRPIHMRVDDSVVRTHADQPYFIRRSRGYAPNPLRLPKAIPSVFAAGAELKNTFCLTRDAYAFTSHHTGDLENLETLQSFEESISHYERLFRIQPEIVACDLHPNYLATRYAQARAAHQQLPLVQVQHHHAHLAACLAENGWDSTEPVIGLSFDGTGYGTDGSIWGGEILVGGYQSFERRFHLVAAPLPGGDAAVRKPARMALAHLWQAGIDWEPDLPPVLALCYEERTALRSQLEHHLNSPLTSSLGRLFDAVSSLLGVCQKATYEGQAAIELEAIADPAEKGAYLMPIEDRSILTHALLEGMLTDWRQGCQPPVIAARFHNSLVSLSLQTCRQVRTETGAHTVALSGGVWQNMFLLSSTVPLLEADGFTVLVHRQLPPNDGCIALGQALVAANQNLSLS